MAEKFILIFHVRVNIYNTVLSSTVALYDTVYTERVRISTVQHRDGSLVYSSSATVLYDCTVLYVWYMWAYVYYGMGVQYSTVQYRGVPGTLVYRHIRHSRGQRPEFTHPVLYLLRTSGGYWYTCVPVQSSVVFDFVDLLPERSQPQVDLSFPFRAFEKKAGL